MRTLKEVDGHWIELEDVICITPYRKMTENSQIFIVHFRGGSYITIRDGDRDAFVCLVKEARQNRAMRMPRLIKEYELV